MGHFLRNPKKQIIAIASIDQELHKLTSEFKKNMDTDNSSKKKSPAQETTDLARERNRLAEIRTEQAAIRTLLANERTFLAWARASLGIITLGFVLEKAALYMKHIIPNANPILMSDLGYLSLFTLICGVVLIITAAVRYFAVEKRIGTRKGLLNPRPEIFILIAVAIVLSISFFYGRSLTF